MKKRALLWLTKDLRVHDNLLLDWAVENSCEIAAVAFLPPRFSELKRQFYLESLAEMQSKLQIHGVDLCVSRGEPLSEIVLWAHRNSVDFILVQDSFNSRDRNTIEQLKKQCGADRVKSFLAETLIDPTKLPFDISKMPLIFTQFRKQIEAAPCLANPVSTNFERLQGFRVEIPPGVELVQRESNRSAGKYPFELQSGEDGAIARVKDYFWTTQAILKYKQTRNGMLLKNDSSKISISLAYGCLSVRTIYAELKRFEEEFGSNESTQWFLMELLWRDYFKFLALKIGDQLFSRNGISQKPKVWKEDSGTFSAWCRGETGADFIDANMRELAETGWMSNRGRQNVASYLAKTLRLDWTRGAQFFEDYLLDFDTESNWGNWLYLAGVGTDPRDRVFNYQLQASTYDADLSYRKAWLKPAVG